MSKATKILIPIIVVLAVILGVLIFVITSHEPEPLPAEAPSSVQSGQSEEPSFAELAGDVGIQEAQIQESQHLSLSSLYTSTIMNPDCNDEYAEDVTSLEVTNTSEKYLLRAELAARMSDGSTITFLLQDLPAGGVAEVFDPQNGSLSDGISCLQIDCVSEEYTDEVPIPEGIITETADSLTYLINNTDSPLEGVTVVYRCDMGGVFFGGVSYETEITTLAPGDRQELPQPSIFGGAHVVRVYKK